LGTARASFWHQPDEPAHSDDQLLIRRGVYDPASERWTLYWSNRHGRWLRYDGKQPTANFASVIREVDEDPVGAFWG
jgi:hypothetical protein